VTIGTLNSAAGHIPEDGPVIIITASFEGMAISGVFGAYSQTKPIYLTLGEPADNAGQFVEVLTSQNSLDLKNVLFAVFGAGNHDWAQTYQRIPRLIDATLEKRGAKRLLNRGEGDAGGDHFAQSFEEWEEGLWKTLSEASAIILDRSQLNSPGNRLLKDLWSEHQQR
jgi:cytochrome P450/NADPH-cytochrome P450 reductase